MPKKPKPLVKSLPIDTLVRDGKLQARVNGLNADHVEDLARVIEAGNLKKLPRPKVMLVQGTGYCVWDGHHTIAAAEMQQLTHITCEITEGLWDEAVLLAAGANAQHDALKRSNADKRKAVEMALAVLPKRTSGAEVARIVGDVSDQFVRNVRRELEGDAAVEEDSKRPSKAEDAGHPFVSATPLEDDGPTREEPRGRKKKAGSQVVDVKELHARTLGYNSYLMELAKATDSVKSPEFVGITRIQSELEGAVEKWAKKLNGGK